jgi:glycosyltransferase involved in cell wall biosynthesis
MTKVPVDVGILFGRPRRSQILAEKLRERGVSVTLYNKDGDPGTYVAVPYSLFPLCSSLLLRSHKVYLAAIGFLPSLCLYLNRVLRRVPYVFNATGLKSATYRERSKQWPFSSLVERVLYPALMDLVLSGASRIVCNSRYLESKLGVEFPKYRGKMVTIYNGIEFHQFASGQRSKIKHIPPKAKILIAVMTWNYEGKARGAKLLIDAMGAVTEKFPDARLVMVGKTSRSQYVKEIEQYLKAKPWSNVVTLLYNQPNVPDLLSSSDLFVYATPPHSNDSLPRALIEAHAAGLAIVSTATAGCPEIVENGSTGLLVPYDAGALATAVVDLLGDSDRREQMGRRGRERVHEVFSWDRMADAYTHLFLEIALDHPQGSSAETAYRGLGLYGRTDQERKSFGD